MSKTTANTQLLFARWNISALTAYIRSAKQNGWLSHRVMRLCELALSPQLPYGLVSRAQAYIVIFGQIIRLAAKPRAAIHGNAGTTHSQLELNLTHGNLCAPGE